MFFQPVKYAVCLVRAFCKSPLVRSYAIMQFNQLSRILPWVVARLIAPRGWGHISPEHMWPHRSAPGAINRATTKNDIRLKFLNCIIGPLSSITLMETCPTLTPRSRILTRNAYATSLVIHL
jgi:hypothetical protein